MFALQSLWSDSDIMNLNLLVHYNQELGVTVSRDWRINSVLSRGCCLASMAESFITGDFMLSKWEEEIEGEGTETQWLPVRLGNHNE